MTSYFQWDNDFYEQRDGVAMGSPLSPVAANFSRTQPNSPENLQQPSDPSRESLREYIRTDPCLMNFQIQHHLEWKHFSLQGLALLMEHSTYVSIITKSQLSKALVKACPDKDVATLSKWRDYAAVIVIVIYL